MTNVSVPQARIRLKILPENLQGVLFSAQTAEVIGRIGEENHLSEDKISRVAEATGVAILGFIHIEELPKEIQERAQVPPEVAKNVAASLENRILNSIRSDLDKIYAPVAAEPEKLEEIKKPSPPAPTGPAPKPFIDLSSLSKTPAPAPPAKPTAAPSPTGLPMQAKWKTYGAAPATPAAAPKTPPPAPLPTTPSVPAPVLLKRKLELEPLKPATGIRLEPTSQFGTAKGAVPQPPRPARLEIGKFTPTAAAGLPKPVRTEMTPPRVVHYSQWQTPTTQVQSPAPTATSAPKPPTPPAPTKPSMPTPPTPPTPPAPSAK